MASADNGQAVRTDQAISHQHDSLPVLFAEVQQGTINAQQAPSTVQNREDDQVFLCGFASENSFVGLLDDKDSISDEEIENFIRQNNPDMYRRLFRDQGVLPKRRSLDNETGYYTLTPTLKSGSLPATRDLGTFCSTPKDHKLQLVLLQIKRSLVSSLLGQYA